ncbi:MAG: helix-turn-helix transcriptional regulator [Bacteroidales bacterium]|nr:helix-turn-helix transcriptional regulator [Bacteroidales bacterium]
MRILDEMESKGMTQKEFAEKAGCSQQYISRILKGRENLSLETISKIESALGTSIVEIKV